MNRAERRRQAKQAQKNGASPTDIALGQVQGYMKANRFSDAISLAEKLIAQQPNYADFYLWHSRALKELGYYEKAIKALEKAISIVPHNAGYVNELGVIYETMGDRGQAKLYYEKAISLSPQQSVPYFNLHSAVYDDENFHPARECLEKSAACDPKGKALAMLPLICRLMDDDKAADHYTNLVIQHIKAGYINHAWHVESGEYIIGHRGAETRFFASKYDTLRYAMDAVTLDGLMLEFGVRFGESLNYLATLTDKAMHGFDSFEGLPEQWANQAKGAYSVEGNMPEVPEHVTLHKGWFEETLPGFVKAHNGPVAFMNVDCDIYSATKTIFDELGERIVPGTVIVFDEYIGNPTWKEDEFKAFQEFVNAKNAIYHYLAFSVHTKQAVVVIDSVGV